MVPLAERVDKTYIQTEFYLDPCMLETVDLLGGLQAVQGAVQLLEQLPPDGAV